ncbi:uncharacterized protein EI97DRAFT_202751 [Westerdykella ornata]|uniref:DUF8021 domain-containing protein n=1 Tax=Westerdykella ornata TaxID=318751 RepID=A0A6A6J7Y6_WESOR|nr:uncharacterized protein EI97DRAFT_202751 [Westerdykella ornata]KAF2272671.1 hypothetical protein EI97DRAFT_202751 [Westerdykella ornata]
MFYALTFTHLFSAASAACTREFLKAATDDYIVAQSAGQPSGVTAFTAPNLTYTENAKAVDITKGTLSIPIKFDYNFSGHDTLQCAAFTELIAATDKHPYVIHTRMVFENSKATLIESIVTDQGDWLFNATGTLNLVKPETWTPIPQAQQDTRAVIQAAGDAYFDRFGNTSVVVPWGPPCYRVEGGLAARGTLRSNDSFCEMVWPSTIIVPYRRYVVDELYGVVDMFIGFPGLDRTQGQAPMPDSHLFRIENGRIKYSHTASACVKDGCGLNGTFGGGLQRLAKRGYRNRAVRLQG